MIDVFFAGIGNTLFGLLRILLHLFAGDYGTAGQIIGGIITAVVAIWLLFTIQWIRWVSVILSVILILSGNIVLIVLGIVGLILFGAVFFLEYLFESIKENFRKNDEQDTSIDVDETEEEEDDEEEEEDEEIEDDEEEEEPEEKPQPKRQRRQRQSGNRSRQRRKNNNEFEEDNKFGFTPGMTKAQKLKQLTRLYSEWNARKSNPRMRQEAIKMCNEIAAERTRLNNS